MGGGPGAEWFANRPPGTVWANVCELYDGLGNEKRQVPYAVTEAGLVLGWNGEWFEEDRTELREAVLHAALKDVLLAVEDLAGLHGPEAQATARRSLQPIQRIEVQRAT